MDKIVLGEVKLLSDTDAKYMLGLTERFNVVISRVVEKEWDKIPMDGARKASLIMEALLSAVICMHLSFIGEKNFHKAKEVLLESIQFNFDQVMETLKDVTH